HRRSHLLLCLGGVSQIHRQHHQRRRGQRAVVYAVRGTTSPHPRVTPAKAGVHPEISRWIPAFAGTTPSEWSSRRKQMTEYIIDKSTVEAENAKHEASLRADYDSLGERLDRRGISIDAI